MSHLTGQPVRSFRYRLHHFARAFGRFPWEVRLAVDSGEIEAGELYGALAIEGADARGRVRKAEVDRLKARTGQKGRRRD